jgi:hypothetical protein
MRKSKFVKLKLREAGFISRALLSTRHPVLAHLIPMRRCNLACGYCNEYDHTSSPVPLEIMKATGRQAGLPGNVDCDYLRWRAHDAPATRRCYSSDSSSRHDCRPHFKCYYFTPDRIKRLNKAGLEYLQISIDNVEPDEVSRKSLRVLDKKLRYLSEYADFHVNINSVIGGGHKEPGRCSLPLREGPTELKFSTTWGLSTTAMEL